VLKEMGQWLKEYGDSIYATRGGPFKPSKAYVTTHRGSRVYVHVLGWASDVITLPAIERKVLSSSLMTGGTVKVEQSADKVEISVPTEHRRDIDTIIVLELDGEV